MSHLSPAQIVDLAEGCADVSASAHAATCERCRAQVASLHRAIQLAELDGQPEPSPLVWPRLAARIGEAVRLEAKPSVRGRRWAWRLLPAGAAAALVVAAGIGFRTWSSPPVAPPARTAAPAAAPALVSAEAAAEGGLADDPSWLLVSDLSAETNIEGVGALGAPPQPGDVDRALLQLDDGERMELARILRDELAPMKPAGVQGPVQGPGA